MSFHISANVSMKHILIILIAMSLAACGGGGGGDTSNGNASPQSSATGLTVTFSSSSLNFDYIEGQIPISQTMTASASGTTTYDVLMGAEVTGSGIATPINVAVNSATRSAAITVTPARSLASGTYTGTISMFACANQSCNPHHGGSPHKVSYVVTVHPALKVAPSAINLAAAENGASATTLTLVAPSANTAVTTVISYKNTQTGWLTAAVNGSTIMVQAAPRSMPAGTYTADLTVKLADGSQQLTVPVALTVSSGLLVPDGASIKVDNTTTTAQLKGTVSIDQASGSGASSWSASSDQPWLKLDTASGAFNTALAWHVDLPAFSPLANGAQHQAVLTVRSDNGLTPKTFRIDAFKTLAQLSGLSGTALLAGQGGDVMLYGNGFGTLSSMANFVSVSGAAPSTVTRLSDQVLRIQLPPLPEGSYDVSIKTASGLATPSKKLSVSRRASYAYQALDTQGLKTAVVWDSVSKSAFVANRTLNSVMRYAEVNGKFQLVTSRSFPFVDSIGMTPDHSALVIQSGNVKVFKLSPRDLSTITTFDLRPGSSGYASNQTVPLTIMGDNRLFMPSFGWVDLDTGATSALSDLNSSYFYMADWGAISGNGLRMLWSASGQASPAAPTARLDLSDGKFAQTSASFFYRYAASYDGNSWAYNNSVVDFDMNLKGRLSVPSGWNGNQMVFSRNGSRLYYYTTGTAFNNKARVFVFDTSKPVTTTVDFPILGYIELDDTPNCPYSSNSGYYDGCYTFETHIAITDDDQTLFIAGDTKFLVVPVPLTLGPTSAPASPGSTGAMVSMSGARH
jgi:hypothetical protein